MTNSFILSLSSFDRFLFLRLLVPIPCDSTDATFRLCLVARVPYVLPHMALPSLHPLPLHQLYHQSNTLQSHVEAIPESRLDDAVL